MFVDDSSFCNLQNAYDATIAELDRRGAGRLSHGAWSLRRHLLGTCAVLEAWTQPRDVCRAGLCHSVYATDAFAPRLFARDERERLRSFIGPRAERLVYLFSELRREEVAQALTAAAGGPVRLAGRTTGTAIDVSGGDLGALAVIHLANVAEQCACADGSPEVWLSRASRLAGEARHLFASVPHIFRDCTAVVDPAAERHFVAAYRRAWLPQRFSTETFRSFAIRTAALPWVGEPYLLLGLAALRRNAGAPAVEYAAAGLALLRAWGTPWDKRLTFDQWCALGTFVTTAGGLPAADRAFIAGRLDTLLSAGTTPQALHALFCRAQDVIPATTAPEPAAGSLPARFCQYLARLGDNRDDPRMGRYPGLTAQAWHDPAGFPLAVALERAAAGVIAEIRALERARFHGETEDIARTGDWDVLMFLERGRGHHEQLAACPTTAAILERFGAIHGLAGLAYVSRLAPGTSVAPHRGPTNLRVRCHFGITVPPGCELVVDGSSRGWSEGRCIVFDDAFEHAVRNAGSADRLVLVVDLWHPDLTVREIELLEGLHRYADAHARNLGDYWARNERARSSPPSALPSRRRS